ncbi:MAG: LuxR family transcriptional regulator [Sphingomonadales bacterium]|nr:LuxR family transcriptional regulator [Sphingomonadales bacterium]
MNEIAGRWPEHALIFIEDRDDAIPRLKQHMEVLRRWLPFIAFSDHPGAAAVVAAMNEGALDYCELPLDPATVPERVRNLSDAANRAEKIFLTTVRARCKVEQLSRREKEVLFSLADGLSNRTIADNLGISPRTVEIHRANMINKLAVSGTSGAIRIAIESSLNV